MFKAERTQLRLEKTAHLCRENGPSVRQYIELKKILHEPSVEPPSYVKKREIDHQ